MFASHAAVAFADAQQLDQLALALDSRDLIGQAKGILMERYHLTPDQAFRVLVRGSKHSNRKLRDVATELTTSGQVTGLTTEAPPPGDRTAPAALLNRANRL